MPKFMGDVDHFPKFLLRDAASGIIAGGVSLSGKDAQFLCEVAFSVNREFEGLDGFW
jgi:hypothetical protein